MENKFNLIVALNHREDSFTLSLTLQNRAFGLDGENLIHAKNEQILIKSSSDKTQPAVQVG